MLIRPVRTLLIVFAAFWAGILYERFERTDKCLDRGGRNVDGICYGDP